MGIFVGALSSRAHPAKAWRCPGCARPRARTFEGTTPRSLMPKETTWLSVLVFHVGHVAAGLLRGGSGGARPSSIRVRAPTLGRSRIRISAESSDPCEMSRAAVGTAVAAVLRPTPGEHPGSIQTTRLGPGVRVGRPGHGTVRRLNPEGGHERQRQGMGARRGLALWRVHRREPEGQEKQKRDGIG
jgi:hypothetical protein